jgi:hypothetical protein
MFFLQQINRLANKNSRKISLSKHRQHCNTLQFNAAILLIDFITRKRHSCNTKFFRRFLEFPVAKVPTPN